MFIDIFSDLGLNGKVNNANVGTENIVTIYIVDSASSNIKQGNVVTFLNNKVKKTGIGEVPNAIALEDAEPNGSVKCQLFGIVTITNLFVSGAIYYTENGEITTVKPVELNKFTLEIGKALNSNELLLKDVFVNV